MKCILWLLILIGMASTSKITLEQLTQMEVSQLKRGQMVEVIHSSQVDHDDNVDLLKREYYIMRTIHRDKRSAYVLMNEMIEKVIFVLKKYKVIPHDRSLVKSKIKPQYRSSKRKWQFSTMFVVFGQSQELKKIYGSFMRMGIKKLNARPSINFLNQKVRALQLFAKAKAKLDNQLQRFPDFEIHQIEEIQFDGLHMPNSDIIQKQIEEEFSDSDENMEQSEIQEDREVEDSGEITVRVVFEVSQTGDQDDSVVEFQEAEDEDSDDTQDDTEQESI